MKRILVILFVLFLMFPLVHAETIKVSGTDLSIDLDEDIWVVFTRENISNEELLNEYDLSYDYINDFFIKSNSYMDAISFWDEKNINTLELFVIMTENKSLTNLNLLEESDIDSLAIELKKSKPIAVDTYDIYDNNNSKYIHYSYEDKGLFLEEYFTIINNKNYVVKFQSSIEYDDEMKQVVKDIMDNVVIDFDISGEDKVKLDNSKKESIWISALKGALIGGVAGGLASIVYSFVFKKKKSKSN